MHNPEEFTKKSRQLKMDNIMEFLQGEGEVGLPHFNPKIQQTRERSRKLAYTNKFGSLNSFHNHYYKSFPICLYILTEISHKTLLVL